MGLLEVVSHSVQHFVSKHSTTFCIIFFFLMQSIIKQSKDSVSGIQSHFDTSRKAEHETLCNKTLRSMAKRP